MAKGKKKPAPKLRKKRITLPAETQLNQNIIDELEALFLMASPRTLMKSVNFIFFQYLFYAEEDGFPNDFKHISEDFYVLQKFFQEASEGFGKEL